MAVCDKCGKSWGQKSSEQVVTCLSCVGARDVRRRVAWVNRFWRQLGVDEPYDGTEIATGPDLTFIGSMRVQPGDGESATSPVDYHARMNASSIEIRRQCRLCGMVSLETHHVIRPPQDLVVVLSPEACASIFGEQLQCDCTDSGWRATKQPWQLGLANANGPTWMASGFSANIEPSGPAPETIIPDGPDASRMVTRHASPREVLKDVPPGARTMALRGKS